MSSSTDRKKDILFVMNSLHMGGAEKALVSLLQVFDYDKYNVDLFLFKKEGSLLTQVPSNVNILPIPPNYHYFEMSVRKAILKNIRNGKFNLVSDRIKFGFSQRKNIPPAQKEQRSWKYIKNHLSKLEKKYDVAIGFLEKSPIYFCVDKVQSAQKIGFIHTDYKKVNLDKFYDTPYFLLLDKIMTVSEESRKTLRKEFPTLKNKFYVLRNIVSSTKIKQLSFEKIPKLSHNTVISVGRLVPSKGYELSLAAFEILKRKDVNFNWIVLGAGELKPLMEQKIIEYGLSENVKLLGSIVNPYPYISNSDVFLHASLFEGDGIVVREAQILSKPIILTNFSTATNHILDNVTGLISEMNPVSLANHIERLLLDKDLSKKLSENLMKKNWGTEQEIEKLYDLIDNFGI